MTEAYRPERRKMTMNDVQDSTTPLQEAQQRTDSNLPPPLPIPPTGGGVEMHGTIPPQLLEEINRRRQEAAAGQAAASQAAARPMPPSNKNLTSPKGMEGLYAQDTTLQDIITKLRNTTHNYDRIQLPSMGKFYDGTDGPVDGLIEIRPMTGEEEQILATPRFVKKGTVIDKIFEKCVRQHIRPEKLLGVDRTYMTLKLSALNVAISSQTRSI